MGAQDGNFNQPLVTGSGVPYTLQRRGGWQDARTVPVDMQGRDLVRVPKGGPQSGEFDLLTQDEFLSRQQNEALRQARIQFFYERDTGPASRLRGTIPEDLFQSYFSESALRQEYARLTEPEGSGGIVTEFMRDLGDHGTIEFLTKAFLSFVGGQIVAGAAAGGAASSGSTTAAGAETATVSTTGANTVDFGSENMFNFESGSLGFDASALDFSSLNLDEFNVALESVATPAASSSSWWSDFTKGLANTAVKAAVPALVSRIGRPSSPTSVNTTAPAPKSEGGFMDSFFPLFGGTPSDITPASANAALGAASTNRNLWIGIGVVLVVLFFILKKGIFK